MGNIHVPNDINPTTFYLNGSFEEILRGAGKSFKLHRKSGHRILDYALMAPQEVFFLD